MRWNELHDNLVFLPAPILRERTGNERASSDKCMITSSELHGEQQVEYYSKYAAESMLLIGSMNEET